jgi:hypothetical protein
VPYISIGRRLKIVSNEDGPGNAGELNYVFTKTLVDYLALKGESYQTYNDILGALEGAKLELYQRKIAVYESTKRTLNGDVY